MRDSQVICIMDNLDRYEYNMKGNNWVSCYPPVLIKEDMSASLTDVTVKACFLFRKNITILITGILLLRLHS